MPSTFALDQTGERFLPWVVDKDYPTGYEHIHRYLFACGYVHNKRVLDIACGEGYGTRMLAAYAASVIGIDNDEATLSHARIHHAAQNIEYMHADAQEFTLPPESVDIVVSFETIEHFRAQESFLGAIKAALAPDGKLIISTPNPAVYIHEGDGPNPFHKRELTRNEFVRLLRGSFANVTLLGQGLIATSIIGKADTKYFWDAEKTLHLATTRITASEIDYPIEERSRIQPRYYVAVCSDAPLPSVPNDMMIDNNQKLFRSLIADRTRLAEMGPAVDEYKKTYEAELRQRVVAEERAEQYRLTVVEQNTLIDRLNEQTLLLANREHDLHERFISAHEQLHGRDSEIQRLRGVEDAHRRDILQKDEYIFQLESRVRLQEEYIGQLGERTSKAEAQLAQAEAQLAQAEAQHEHKDWRISGLESHVQAKDTYIGEIEERLSQANERLNQADERLNQAEAQLAERNRHITELAQWATTIETQLAQVTTWAGTMEAELLRCHEEHAGRAAAGRRLRSLARRAWPGRRT